MPNSSTSSTVEALEFKCRQFIQKTMSDVDDSAHDLEHVSRVVKNSKWILKHEDADAEVVLAAAWLHDSVIIPKDHPDRKRASVLAANKASEFLQTFDFPTEKIAAVEHAIEAHSFSAGIKPQSMEAKIVQDADRLDAIGAIGIARCLLVGGGLNRPLYHPDDPLCKNRRPDDKTWTIDHFYKKLFRLPGMMHTSSAKEEAERRVAFMKEFLRELELEI